MLHIFQMPRWASNLLDWVLIRKVPNRQNRQLGLLEGQLIVGPGFFEQLPSEELDAWE